MSITTSFSSLFGKGLKGKLRNKVNSWGSPECAGLELLTEAPSKPPTSPCAEHVHDVPSMNPVVSTVQYSTVQ